LLALKTQFDSWRQTRSSKSTIPHHLPLLPSLFLIATGYNYSGFQMRVAIM
jgi:hypothetical protein